MSNILIYILYCDLFSIKKKCTICRNERYNDYSKIKK